MSEQNFLCNLETGEFERTDLAPGRWWDERTDDPIVVASSYLAVKKAAIGILQCQRSDLANLIATIRSSRKGWL